MADMKKQASERLLPIRNLTEYFMNSVGAAMESNNVSVDEHTAHYIVNLLTLFSRSEALYEESREGPGIRPLALMLADAAQAPTDEQRQHVLQRLGDISLFVAGFFSDGLQHSPVDVDYYINMGGGAYRTLSIHVRGTIRGRVFAEVFSELGEKFHDIVDVLNEVRDTARPPSDEQILRLYEVWLRTGSTRAERLLGELGVQPVAQDWEARKH